MLIKGKTNEITYKGVTLLLDEKDFKQMQSFRKNAIDNKSFAKACNPGGLPYDKDRLAMAGQYLEEGGEVTGGELGVIYGPMGSESRLLAKTFGKDYHTDW